MPRNLLGPFFLLMVCDPLLVDPLCSCLGLLFQNLICLAQTSIYFSDFKEGLRNLSILYKQTSAQQRKQVIITYIFVSMY